MIRDLMLAAEATNAARAKVCIIGGGIAGLIAAYRLADAGVQTIVLESGSRSHGGGIDPLHQVEGVAPGEYGHPQEGRVRALGGTSELWGGAIIPLTPGDMAARPHIDAPAWPISHERLYARAADVERMFGMDCPGLEAIEPKVGLGEAAGLIARDAKFIRRSRRQLGGAFARGLAGRPCVEIWLNANVTAFDLDNERGLLAAVRARAPNGRTLRVEADRFILAAGTLESTRLLLLLDRQSQGRAFAGCEALGRYFNDHLKVDVAYLQGRSGDRLLGMHLRNGTRRQVRLESSAEAQAEDRVASGYLTTRYAPIAGSIGDRLDRVKASAPRAYRSIMSAAKEELEQHLPAAYRKLRELSGYGGGAAIEARIEQAPRFDCRLALGATMDEFGVPRLAIDWRRTAADEATFAAMVRRGITYWSSTQLGSLAPATWHDPDRLASRLVAESRSAQHPAGGARMGTDPRTSVADADLRCHAVPNVSLATAAAFPSSGSANPTLTIMMLAMIAADAVLQPLSRAPLAVLA